METYETEEALWPEWSFKFRSGVGHVFDNIPEILEKLERRTDPVTPEELGPDFA